MARVEFMDAASVRSVNQYSKLSLRETPLLVFEFHGSPAGARASGNRAFITAEHGGITLNGPNAPGRPPPVDGAPYFAGSAGPAAAPPPTFLPISRLADCVRDTVEELIMPASRGHHIVGHVGDGNFHVLMLTPQLKNGKNGNDQSLTRCAAIAADGTCTGEHGVGLHKMQSGGRTWRRCA